MTLRQPLSAVIITLDAAHQLAACLESVSFADELLVVDSGSSDATVALAEAHGARVIHQPWLGYGPQKQFAVDRAAHPWVLCLDADERVTPELAASIRAALENPAVHAYDMARRNRFMGRWLRHGEGYPDPNLRLFHRDHARWSRLPVHEHVEADGPVQRLRGDLLHASEEGLEAYLAKQNRYTTLQARELVKRGKRVGMVHLLLSPLARFIKFTILRLGFLDGVPGLVHIVTGCHNSFMKYAKAYAMQRQGDNGAPGDDDGSAAA